MKLINDLLKVTAEEIEDVRKKYNKTPEEIKTDVQILKHWLLKQPHLPQNYDEDRLERMLLRNKFRIEESKSKIDNYFTLRGLYPQFFPSENFQLEDFEKTRKSVIFIPIPYMNDLKERIVCMKLTPECEPNFDFGQYFKYVFAFIDLELSHDYAISTTWIVDLTNFTTAHARALQISVALKGNTLYQSACSARISGIHWINTPKYSELILKMLQLAMRPKMFAKIKLHKDNTSLQDIVNKKYLPSNYGGNQKSIEEIHEMMGKMWSEEVEFLAANAQLVSNESLRTGAPYKSDLFGLEGTFKQINLD